MVTGKVARWAGWEDRDDDAPPFQILAPGGQVPGERDWGLRDENVPEALRWMLLSRALDEKCTNLQRQGRLGLYASVLGQEAAVIGSHMAIDPAVDWLVPASREQPAMLRHGWTLDQMLASYLGRIDAARIPDEVKMLPRQQSIATQLPHAVGIAWAIAMQELDGVVLTYCGDGAASEGDFHEACNLAGVVGAPVVFVIINNQYAISTHASRQSSARRLAYRAKGYGFPGVTVDGNDLVAVHEVTRRAVERARARHGPTMIEAVTYRVGAHNTSDNAALYRDRREVEEAAAQDPVDRLVAYAVAAGLTSQETLEAQRLEVREEVEAALDRALSFPGPRPEDLFKHVFAD